MEINPGRLSQLCGIALIAWLVVGTALWMLGGPTGGAAVGAAIGGTLTVLAGIWWVSGRSATPWPTMIALHAFVALMFGSLMILVTYSIEASAAATTLTAAARSARFLGAEFVFWIWLYAVLAAGSYGVRMQGMLRAERETTARSEARAAEARLASLRGQLNPHFLFNALHDVAGLVGSDPDAAIGSLEQLGELLRYSLDEAGRITVELTEELRFTRTYLGLAGVALGDRLRTTIDVDERALSARVPPFSLQVLAENAVRHGIAPRPDGGAIDLCVRLVDGGVELVVRNDGVGPSADRAPGGGLANLRARLDVLYGPPARLEAAAIPAGGFRARVFVPAS